MMQNTNPARFTAMILLLFLASCAKNAQPNAASSAGPEAERTTLAAQAEARRQPPQSDRKRPATVPDGSPSSAEGAVAPAGIVAPDVLLVDAEPLSSAEVLYPLREQIERARAQASRTALIDDMYRATRRQAQEEIGRILMYRQSFARLTDAQKTALDNIVKREIAHRVEKDFSGSHARFEAHLKRHGLTPDQFQMMQKRQVMVQQQLYETIVPQLRLRRDELLAFYRAHSDLYIRPETRELWMIEAPFERFLPEGMTWPRADATAQAQARLKAVRHIRETHAALADKPFDEVARAYCRGVHATEGGAWGMIGKPLQAPYDIVSAPLFQLEEGQFTAPIETANGWYIVRCGTITPARQVPFEEVQDEIRKTMMDQRFAELAGEHVRKLAEKASISSFESFISETVRLVVSGAWPKDTSEIR